jgi:hypothetical protein
MTSPSPSASPPAGTVHLVVDEATPSVNKLHGQHWTRKHRMRARWGWLVKAAMLSAKVQSPKPIPPRVRLTIERWGARMLDESNFIAGTKWLEDALVAEGFMVDDSPEHVEHVFHQHIDRKQRRTVVRIEAIKPKERFQ